MSVVMVSFVCVCFELSHIWVPWSLWPSCSGIACRLYVNCLLIVKKGTWDRSNSENLQIGNYNPTVTCMVLKLMLPKLKINQYILGEEPYYRDNHVCFFLFFFFVLYLSVENLHKHTVDICDIGHLNCSVTCFYCTIIAWFYQLLYRELLLNLNDDFCRYSYELVLRLKLEVF